MNPGPIACETSMLPFCEIAKSWVFEFSENLPVTTFFVRNKRWSYLSGNYFTQWSATESPKDFLLLPFNYYYFSDATVKSLAHSFPTMCAQPLFFIMYVNMNVKRCWSNCKLNLQNFWMHLKCISLKRMQQCMYCTSTYFTCYYTWACTKHPGSHMY